MKYFYLTHKWDPIIGTTTLGQSEPGSNGNERILYILHSPRTGNSLSESLLLYPWGGVRFAEMQSAYSTARVDWPPYDCMQTNDNYRRNIISCTNIIIGIR